MRNPKNRISSVLVSLLCLLALFGCSVNDGTLSTKEKEALEEVWTDAGYGPLEWLDENDQSGAVYYGKYADCHILMVQEPPVVVTVMFHVYVADRKFDCSRPFALYAIQGDQVYSLNEAYEFGLLTDGHIQQIYDFHTSG